MKLLLGTALALVACQSQPASTVAKESSIAAVERGRYLANAVADCFDCHSPLLDTLPPVPVPHLLGSGDILNEETGLVAPNITADVATGAGSWTDEQLERAVRRGIGHDGRRLSPSMPSNYYSALSDSDVASIISYLRTLSPVRHDLPKGRPQEPATPDIPPIDPVEPVTLQDPVSRGGYLVRLARCITCHTPLTESGQLDSARPFSGGKRFTRRNFWYVEADPDPRLPEPDSADLLGDNVIASANLTPHASGLAHYDVAVFVKTLRTGKVNGVRPLTSAMPWVAFQHMTTEDLGAIFSYLRSLEPMAHRVSNQEPPTYCPVCGRRHGLGESNARYALGR